MCAGQGHPSTWPGGVILICVSPEPLVDQPWVRVFGGLIPGVSVWWAEAAAGNSMQGLCLVGLGNAEGCQLACHSPNPQASEALTLSWGSCPPGPSQGELGHLWALTTTASYPQERKVLPKPQARRPRQDPADRKIEPKRKRGGMGCGCPSRNLPISSFRTTRRDGPLTGPPPPPALFG